jgi:hypothetical protein
MEYVYGRLKALTRKPAIWARLTNMLGCLSCSRL